MNVQCKVTYAEGLPAVPVFGRGEGVQAIVSCTRCGQCMVGSASDRSITRLLVMLSRTCPRRERNFYVREEESEGARYQGGEGDAV